jgi:hypothetical protein
MYSQQHIRLYTLDFVPLLFPWHLTLISTVPSTLCMLWNLLRDRCMFSSRLYFAVPSTTFSRFTVVTPTVQHARNKREITTTRHEVILLSRSEKNMCCPKIDDRFGVVVGILTYYARGRGFDSRTVQTFVCMNMSVCIWSGCFYV